MNDLEKLTAETDRNWRKSDRNLKIATVLMWIVVGLKLVTLCLLIWSET